jgi:polysaccharide transporter, PST family
VSAPAEPQTVDVAASTTPLGSLRETSARGFVWTFTQALAVRVLSLLGFVVLARLLSPHDYGLVAIANVFVYLLQILAAGGLGGALVQRPEVDDVDLDSVFWIGLGISAALTLLLVAAAWPLASIYHQPDLRPVLQVLSLTFLAIGVGSTPSAVLQRRLQFRAIAIATMIANVVATVVGVAFAYAGFGVWSLVVQTILGIAVPLPYLIARSGYRPGRAVSVERFRDLFKMSRLFVGQSLLGFLNSRTDDFLVGSALGSIALGIYSVGYRIETVALDVLASAARNVAFPVFARVQHDRARLGRAYTSVAQMSTVIAAPGFMLMFAAAPEIIHVVFGAKWDAAIPVMRILCLFGPLQSAMQFNSSLLGSTGHAGLSVRIGVVSTILQVIAFAIAVSFGIEWVAASFVIRAYLIAPVWLVAAARIVNGSVRHHVGALMPPAISSLAMTAAVMALGHELHGIPDTARLLVMLGAGPFIYVAVLWAIGRDALHEAIDYARLALPGRLRPARVAAQDA